LDNTPYIIVLYRNNSGKVAPFSFNKTSIQEPHGMATDILRASGVVAARLYNPAGRSSIIGTHGMGSGRLRGRQENRVVVGADA
jgi:hypothetical protein